MILLVLAHPGSSGHRAVKRLCVCVCVCVSVLFNMCCISDCIRCNESVLAVCVSSNLQEARSYAEENRLLFLETSAKTGSNVNEIFLLLGQYTARY